MAAYKDLTKEELLELKSGLQAQFEEVKARGLKLDMSRGKPAAAQLNLSMEMMNILNSGTDLVCEEIMVAWMESQRQNSFWQI